MRRDPLIVLAAALLLTVSGSATSDNAQPAPSTAIEPGAKALEELDPKSFDRSENIDNPWWTLKPGTQFVFEGNVEVDGERTPHRIVFNVTDLTKMVGGVRCRVILDGDWSGGKMIETELTFFAQDRLGNIWHLGQYRETYESEFVGGRIWHVGNPEGAKAGIMVPADPRLGTPSYSEGFAPPPFNWTDRGRVYQMGQKVRGPTGSYDDVLVIEEFDAEHADEFQLKYYARGAGNIRVGWRGAGKEHENLELVRIVHLGPKELDEVRARAFDLEKRAYMYCTLPPAERAPMSE